MRPNQRNNWNGDEWRRIDWDEKEESKFETSGNQYFRKCGGNLASEESSDGETSEFAPKPPAPKQLTKV